LIHRLGTFADLTEAETRALLDVQTEIRRLGTREEVIHDGASVHGVSLMLEGYGCSYKLLPDGRRQITGYFVPGDLCDTGALVVDRSSQAVGTLSPASIGFVERDVLRGMMDTFPGIRNAIWSASIIQEAVSRQWLTSVGQRTAYERLAHLICEMFIRLRMVGLTRENSCDFPVTQAELADTLGLSTVHVNRTLQELRRDNLISLRGRTLAVLDFDALQRVSMFDPSYLTLGRLPIRTPDQLAV
jgi:CRP-like cAMP-binding protein